MNIFDYVGSIGHYDYYGWNWNAPSMYEVGKFFLSHRMVVRRCKNKRKGKRK